MSTHPDRQTPETMLREVASLFHLIGGMGARHLVLVGGLVPPLLLSAPDEPHIGSADIDVCLSIAITQGATREYYRSIEAKIAPYFANRSRVRASAGAHERPTAPCSARRLSGCQGSGAVRQTRAQGRL